MFSTVKSYIPGWSVFFQAALTIIIPIIAYYVYKRFYSFVSSRSTSRKQSTVNRGASQQTRRFYEKLDDNFTFIKSSIGSNSDVHFRHFFMTGLGARALLVSIDGMQEDKQVNTLMMKMLTFEVSTGQTKSGKINWDMLLKLLPIDPLRVVYDLHELNRSILFGNTALLIEGFPAGLLVSLPDGASRSISEPVSESLLRGPRLGFTESLSENTSMLRRQGIIENLEIRSFKVGSQIQRNLAIAYINDIVNPDLLQEVVARIKRIDIDFAAESGYIEQLIEDNPLSPFQQVQNTERPDRVISALLEGRVGLLLDGTPFALIVPATFSMLLQSPEDYYERWLPGSLLRMLRFLAAFIALMAPSLYISFISFHPGLIPTELAITIIETRQGVPFPSLIEVLILEVSIEILREAGIRLPKPIGPAMGIVGGLVIGEAAVQAGIVSPFLVIVVAVTAISSFSIPTYSAGITLRVLRFVGMLFASILGMFGTILFFLLICSHLTKLRSFGIPYLVPFSPFRWSDWKDLFFRAPLALMKRRPVMMKPQNDKRRS